MDRAQAQFPPRDHEGTPAGVQPGTWAFDRRVIDRRVIDSSVIDSSVTDRSVIDRSVTDRRLARSGCVHGQLLVTAVADGQDWDESGQLMWNGALAPVSRSLRLRRRDGRWWMHFADGRPFHPWLPGAEIVHQCGADVYRGRISIGSGPDDRPRMRTEWAVTGPAKDQLLITRLRLLA